MSKKPSPKPEIPHQPEEDLLAACQVEIGHTFTSVELLRSALTHASGATTRLDSFERLEFLGDSILGLVACEALFRRFPAYEEGELTRVKSAVVSRRTCARLAEEMGLRRFLILGKGFNAKQSLMSSNLMANVYESLIGAIYLDAGIEAARTFIHKRLDAEIDAVDRAAGDGNYKSLLQEKGQREFGITPLYIVIDEKGPDHSKCFKMAAVVGEKTFHGAWGRNKKEAEQRASMNALAAINGQPVPFDHS